METERLVMRRWRPEDRGPFAEMNRSPMVMAHFPAPLTRAESDALIERIESGFERDGFGLWALEVRASGEFIGFTGLAIPSFEAAFTPAVEVGWRLRESAWGHGYATEAGYASLAFGFQDLGLQEVVSFASAANLRSEAVMRRLGMDHNPADDFDHPRFALESPLRRFVLYRMSAARWREHSH